MMSTRWSVHPHPTRPNRQQYTFVFPFPIVVPEQAHRMDCHLGRRFISCRGVPMFYDVRTMVREAFVQVVTDRGIRHNRSSPDCNAARNTRWVSSIISHVLLEERACSEQGKDDQDQLNCLTSPETRIHLMSRFNPSNRGLLSTMCHGVQQILSSGRPRTLHISPQSNQHPIWFMTQTHSWSRWPTQCSHMME